MGGRVCHPHPILSRAFVVKNPPHRGAGGFLRHGLRRLQLPLAHELLAESLGLLERRRLGLGLAEAQLHVLGDGEVASFPAVAFPPLSAPACQVFAPDNSLYAALALQATEVPRHDLAFIGSGLGPAGWLRRLRFARFWDGAHGLEDLETLHGGAPSGRRELHHAVLHE